MIDIFTSSFLLEILDSTVIRFNAISTRTYFHVTASNYYVMLLFMLPVQLMHKCYTHR